MSPFYSSHKIISRLRLALSCAVVIATLCIAGCASEVAKAPTATALAPSAVPLPATSTAPDAPQETQIATAPVLSEPAASAPPRRAPLLRSRLPSVPGAARAKSFAAPPLAAAPSHGPAGAHRQSPRLPAPEAGDGRAPLQHIIGFQMPVITVLDKAYGQPKVRLKPGDFPKVRMPGRESLGVPVYARDGAYVEVLLADGSTGWISHGGVQLTARPCATRGGPITTRTGSAPVSAGSGQFAC